MLFDAKDLHKDFILKPINNAFIVHVANDDLCLFLDSLLETFVVTLEKKNLPVCLSYGLELGLELLSSDLSHVLHVSLHGDKSLVVFFKGLFCCSQGL